MYPQAFEDAVTFTLRHEGGYSHDSRDPGGETNMGISKRAHPDVDIRNLTREQAKAIYYRYYWLTSGAERLPPALALHHFDAAVNHGPTQAQRFLVASEGSAARYAAVRLQFFTNISGWPVFGKGWARRVAAALEAGERLGAPHAHRRLKTHLGGEFRGALEIPAGKRVVVALESDGSVNLDIR